ncbi:hypothetical protein H4R22_002118 [Coemansia sp. RSA 1290]|nr:hypothetical protein LPJ55_001363 [Coemansia sp. RSA 990]KAJ2631240.1 hypothetical protein H4R22_002118 [Coemansia sp. RSA 1290]
MKHKTALLLTVLLAFIAGICVQAAHILEPELGKLEPANIATYEHNAIGKRQDNATTTSETSISPRLKTVRFIAGLFWASPSGLQRRCAATIITSNTLVTSAICAKSDYPASKYGQGGWRIVTGAEERYMQTPPSSAQAYVVSNVQIDECSNFAIITIEGSMTFGGGLMPVFISSHPVDQGATLYTFKTAEPAGRSFLSLTNGIATECDKYLPGYADENFLCTQPVLGQTVTNDYLGGDPIIGFSSQPDGSLAVLVGVTGLYYSTLEEAQTASANDATAYRFNALAAPHVRDIATLAGVSPESLVSTGKLS